MDINHAPWTTAQVETLNRWQHETDMRPMTCPQHEHSKLKATRDGFVCPVESCRYTQNWTPEFTLHSRPMVVAVADDQRLMSLYAGLTAELPRISDEQVRRFARLVLGELGRRRV